MVSLCLLVLGVRCAAAVQTADLVEAEVHFLYGMEDLHAGRFGDAVNSFREAMNLDPQDGTFHCALGLALLRLERLQEAEGTKEACLHSPRPSRIDPQRFVSQLQAAQRAPGGAAEPEPREHAGVPEWRPASVPFDERPRWKGEVAVSAGADSNPNLLSEDFLLPTPDGKLVDGSFSDGVAGLALRAGYHAPCLLRGWRTGLDFEARQSFYRELDYLNLGQARAVVHMARGRDPLGFLQGPMGSTPVPFGSEAVSILLQGALEHYRLDNEPYLTSFTLAASLILRESLRTATELSLVVQDREFSQEPSGDRRRSGEDARLEVSQLFSLGRRDRYLRLALSAGDRQAGRAESAARHEAGAEVMLPLVPKWTLRLAGARREDRYDHRESNLFHPTGERREDTTWRGETTLLWAVTPRLRFTLNVLRVERESSVDLGSNLPDLGYARAAGSIGLEWLFR